MNELIAAAANPVPVEKEAVAQPDFAVIVRENQAMVYSIALHFLHEPALAEELAQEVFLQLFQNLGRLRSRAHITFWLRKVTSHRCIDYARRRSQATEVALDRVPEPVTAGEFSDPLLRSHLRKLVASLPEKKRLLIILRYQEEMEVREIARVLRRPVRTVRTQLWRTLAQLREKSSRLLEGGNDEPTG